MGTLKERNTIVYMYIYTQRSCYRCPNTIIDAYNSQDILEFLSRQKGW